jgi:hypothetical protein
MNKHMESFRRFSRFLNLTPEFANFVKTEANRLQVEPLIYEPPCLSDMISIVPGDVASGLVALSCLSNNHWEQFTTNRSGLSNPDSRKGYDTWLSVSWDDREDHGDDAKSHRHWPASPRNRFIFFMEQQPKFRSELERHLRHLFPGAEPDIAHHADVVPGIGDRPAEPPRKRRRKDPSVGVGDLLQHHGATVQAMEGTRPYESFKINVVTGRLVWKRSPTVYVMPDVTDGGIRDGAYVHVSGAEDGASCTCVYAAAITRGATIMGRSFDGPACVHERFYMEEIRYRDDVENTSGTAIQELPNPRGTGMRKFSVIPPDSRPAFVNIDATGFLVRCEDRSCHPSRSRKQVN